MAQRRVFIGPMPEKVITQTEATQHKRTQLTIGSVFSLSQQQPDDIYNADKIEGVTRLLREHAFHFFLHEGGRPEDWDEEGQEHITDELAKRWKSSEWGQLWTRRHHRRKKESQSVGAHQWFGTSFEVGTLMGVNVLQGEEHLMNFSARCNPTGDEIAGSSRIPLEAHSSQLDVISTDAPSITQVNGDVPKSTLSVETNTETPTTSRTALVPLRHSDTMLLTDDLSRSNDQQVASESILQPTMSANISRLSAINDGQPLSNVKGKAKAVRYSEHPGPDLFLSPSLVPPEEVLKRTSTVDASSSMAVSISPQGPMPSPTPSDVRWGDVILRGIYNCFNYPIIHQY